MSEMVAETQAKPNSESFQAGVKASLESEPRLKPPWAFRSALGKRERADTYRRFEYYLGLGPGRTLTAVASHFGVSLPSVSMTAKNYSWQTRAAAYDEFEAIREADRERQERHDEHMRRLEEFRGRSEKVGEAMIASAAQLLSHCNRTLKNMQVQGEELDRKLLASALQASARVAESGRVLMAQSLGIEALLGNLDDAEGDIEDRYS